MAAGGFEVGRISARLDAIFDDRGFDKFDRALKNVRADAKRGAEAVLKADDDKFSTAIKRFHSEMRKARAERDVEVDVKADVDQSSFRKAEKALDDVERKSGRLRGTIGKLGPAAGVAGAAAATGFGLFSKSGITAATDIAESMSKLQTVLGRDATASIEKFANTSATSLGMSKQEALSATGTFASFYKLIGKGSEESAKLSVDMTKLAADMASFNNSTPEEALTALQAGLRGEAEPLRRFNVMLDDATLRQQAVKDGLIETTKEALTPQQKALAAHAVIMKQTATQQGDFARTSGGLANQQRILKAQFANASAELGTKLLPIALKVVNGMNKLFGVFKGGGKDTDGIRAKLSGLRGVVNGVGNVFRAVFGFVRKVIDDNRDTIDTYAGNVRSVARSVGRFVKQIGDVFRDVFGSGSGISGDVRRVVRVVGQFLAHISSVASAVVRRILPSIGDAFRGVATIVRGVVRVVSGILSGDFGKAWDGAKDIVSGAIKAVRSIIGGAAGGLKAAITKAFGGVFSYLGTLPGKFLNAGANAGKALLRGIAGAFSSVGGFAADIGRSIANWINANTPFGDRIKVGPVSVRLPSLRRGGKGVEGGKVGPGFGGMRAFIAGEGELPEWVISQQGDRRQNAAWAKEALETLTGRRVELHKGGRGKKKKVKHKSVSEVVGRTRARSISRGNAGLKNYEDDIQRMEREYGQMDRAFNLSDEQILIENDDGSVTIDAAAQKKRSDELTALIKKRSDIKKKVEDYMDAVQRLMSSYRVAIRKLRRAIKAAKGKVHSKDRAKYRAEIEDYEDRILELSNVAADLPLDIEDQNLDIAELRQERDALSEGTRPADAAEPVSDIPGGEPGGEPGAAAPTAAQIAEAAALQVAAFQQNRADLFGSFGSNFVPAGGTAFGDATQQAAGMRFFGATSSGDNPGIGGGSTTKNYNVTFERGPDDPVNFSRGLEFELGILG